MKLLTLISLARSLYNLCKRSAPVLAVLAVLFAKLAAGDLTGLPELLTALIAAATAVWNGEKVAQLTSSMRVMQGAFHGR